MDDRTVSILGQEMISNIYLHADNVLYSIIICSQNMNLQMDLVDLVPSNSTES